MATGLDGKPAKMTKLHQGWNKIQIEYERLWDHHYEATAENTYAEIQRRADDVSENGTEVPYDENLIGKWQDRVEAERGISSDTLAESHPTNEKANGHL
jgi:hypothetical protein